MSACRVGVGMSVSVSASRVGVSARRSEVRKGPPGRGGGSLHAVAVVGRGGGRLCRVRVGRRLRRYTAVGH